VAKRAQTLNFINGYAVPGERTRRAAPAVHPEPAPAPVAPAQVAPKRTTGLPMSTLPKFIEYDRKVCVLPLPTFERRQPRRSARCFIGVLEMTRFNPIGYREVLFVGRDRPIDGGDCQIETSTHFPFLGTKCGH
jgi:hypothetical protein